MKVNGSQYFVVLRILIVAARAAQLLLEIEIDTW